MKFDLSAWLPFLRWWPRVNRTTTRADLIAGLTGGLILVPQGVAFATIAGMPPEYGLCNARASGRKKRDAFIVQFDAMGVPDVVSQPA